tara:strand:+ start:13177 stop:13848 length:672 start_codon:yes stop_codon:yes gene_type:complete
MSKTIVVLTLSLLSFYTAHAQDPYFEISKVEVTEVESAPVQIVESFQEKNLNGVIMQAKGLIALGKEIWKIIEAGRPVSNHTAMQTITVLPKDEDGEPVDVMDMESWNLPSAKSYRVEYKNGFGMTVIGFTYTVIFQWGGSYNGKGKYLTGVNVMADDISVSWGFNFSADSQLLSITNTGTKLNPVAAATLTVKYRAKSVVSDISSSETFYVTGSGKIGKLHK